MKTTARWFWGVVIAQAAFLLTWAGWHEHVRSHAPVILLKTRPVDPQDLLRGDYMILAIKDGDECWVLLEPREGYYAAVNASADKPVVSGAQIAVRATKSWSGLKFGIENYYVPEGKGTPRFTRIEVEAAVSATSRLYIKRVLLDGKAYP
jgi:uncharacterized membrane-anchored protein